MASDSEQNLNQALIEAVKNGAIEDVQRLLTAGADPDYWDKEFRTPLLHAAKAGFDNIVDVLLKANADPDKWILTDCKPFAAASLLGHDGAARLIRDHQLRRREARARELLERRGWSLGFADEQVELVLSGTEHVDDPAGLLESCWANPPDPLEVPFTTFEGWTKQMAVEDLGPFAQEAAENAFPLFHDLAVPPLALLERLPFDARSYHFSGSRVRRFGGDATLPRARYATLASDDSKSDSGTLTREMLAYADIRRTGALELIDLSDPAGPDRLKELGLGGLENPRGYAGLLLLFLAGPNTGLSEFIMDMGLPQKILRVPLPVRMEYKRIERVVDLRVPDAADWFARVVSRAVLQVRTPPSPKVPPFVKCFPRRPALDRFGQILPALLTQELGGGAVSVVAGRLLRDAGVEGLIFPSARNDSRLRVKNGAVRRSTGWNVVDYRGAPPPKQNMIVIDVDRSWPAAIRMGANLSLRENMDPDLFSTRASIDYEDSGPYRGSFEVEGVRDVHDMIRELELTQKQAGTWALPWWAR